MSRIALVMIFVALAGCSFHQPGVYEHHVKIEPIQVEPIHVTMDINVRESGTETSEPEKAPGEE